MGSPRDIFFREVYYFTKQDKDIYIVSDDFGCQVLDEFKKDFPHRYINVGVAEQNAILVATGLALEGKIVFVYGIASFITMRCYEQIRINLDGMDLPVTIAGVGVDDDYKEAGFTHWAYEDIPLMNSLKNMVIYDVTKNEDIPKIVSDCISKPHPKYVRLRRK